MTTRGPTPRSWAQTKQRMYEEPLVPLGVMATALMLLGGFGSFVKGNSANSQYFMRARVAAQGFTLAVLAYGAYSNFDAQKLGIKRN